MDMRINILDHVSKLLYSPELLIFMAAPFNPDIGPTILANYTFFTLALRFFVTSIFLCSNIQMFLRNGKLYSHHSVNLNVS